VRLTTAPLLAGVPAAAGVPVGPAALVVVEAGALVGAPLVLSVGLDWGALGAHAAASDTPAPSRPRRTKARRSYNRFDVHCGQD
jgi:hypothetical protein